MRHRNERKFLRRDLPTNDEIPNVGEEVRQVRTLIWMQILALIVAVLLASEYMSLGEALTRYEGGQLEVAMNRRVYDGFAITLNNPSKADLSPLVARIQLSREAEPLSLADAASLLMTNSTRILSSVSDPESWTGSFKLLIPRLDLSANFTVSSFRDPSSIFNNGFGDRPECPPPPGREFVLSSEHLADPVSDSLHEIPYQTSIMARSVPDENGNGASVNPILRTQLFVGVYVSQYMAVSLKSIAKTDVSEAIKNLGCKVMKIPQIADTPLTAYNQDSQYAYILAPWRSVGETERHAYRKLRESYFNQKLAVPGTNLNVSARYFGWGLMTLSLCLSLSVSRVIRQIYFRKYSFVAAVFHITNADIQFSRFDRLLIVKLEKILGWGAASLVAVHPMLIAVCVWELLSPDFLSTTYSASPIEGVVTLIYPSNETIFALLLSGVLSISVSAHLVAIVFREFRKSWREQRR